MSARTHRIGVRALKRDRNGARRSARGFSLFEVMLGIMLLAALGGTVWGFLTDLRRQRESVSERGEALHAAEAVLERLEADLNGCIAGTEALGAGIRGDNASIRVLSRGVTAPLGRDVVAAGDLQGCEFRFEKSSGQLMARRWDPLGTQGEGNWQLVSDRLERVRFRYHDGRAWRSSFDSTGGGLPAAVEVAMWFSDEPRVVNEQSGDLGTDDAEAERFGDDGKRTDRRSRDEEMLDPGDLLPDEDEAEFVAREPDRTRVIVIPDGPRAGLALLEGGGG